MLDSDFQGKKEILWQINYHDRIEWTQAKKYILKIKKKKQTETHGTEHWNIQYFIIEWIQLCTSLHTSSMHSDSGGFLV